MKFAYVYIKQLDGTLCSIRMKTVLEERDDNFRFVLTPGKETAYFILRENMSLADMIGRREFNFTDKEYAFLDKLIANGMLVTRLREYVL